MHEEKFYLIEGKKMTLLELAKEIESATGGELEDIRGSIDRVVVKKPAPEQGFEAFTVTFKMKHTVDLVDAVVTTDNKKKHLADYDFENSEFTVRLISYIRRDVPMKNDAEL